MKTPKFHTLPCMKFAAVCALLFICENSFALDFYCGRIKGEKNLKWSTCVWGPDAFFNTQDLPGKPEANDDIHVRFGNYVLTLDKDVMIRSFKVHDGAKLISDKHKMITKNNFEFVIPCSGNRHTDVDLKDSNFEIGGMMTIGFYSQARGAGCGEFKLDNSSFLVKSGLSCIIPVNPSVFVPKERVGITISLKGKSLLKFNGGADIDPIFVDTADTDTWFLRFKFEDDNGKMPLVSFAKRCNFDACEIEVRASKYMKVGKYTLMNFDDKKSSVEKAKKVFLNGKKVAFGENVDLDGKKAVLEIAPNLTGKDNKTKNDLVLTIK